MSMELPGRQCNPSPAAASAALVAMVDESFHAYLSSHVPEEVDRQSNRLFSTIRDIVGGDEWEETRIPRDGGENPE